MRRRIFTVNYLTHWYTAPTLIGQMHSVEISLCTYLHRSVYVLHAYTCTKHRHTFADKVHLRYKTIYFCTSVDITKNRLFSQLKQNANILIDLIGYTIYICYIYTIYICWLSCACICKSFVCLSRTTRQKPAAQCVCVYMEGVR